MPPNANPSPENRAAIRPYFGDDDGLQSLNNGRWHWGGLGPLNFPMIRFPCFGSLFYPSRRNPANCDNDGWNLSWCCWFYSKNAKDLRYFQGDDNSRFLNQEKKKSSISSFKWMLPSDKRMIWRNETRFFFANGCNWQKGGFAPLSYTPEFKINTKHCHISKDSPFPNHRGKPSFLGTQVFLGCKSLAKLNATKLIWFLQNTFLERSRCSSIKSDFPSPFFLLLSPPPHKKKTRTWLAK